MVYGICYCPVSKKEDLKNLKVAGQLRSFVLGKQSTTWVTVIIPEWNNFTFAACYTCHNEHMNINLHAIENKSTPPSDQSDPSIRQGLLCPSNKEKGSNLKRQQINYTQDLNHIKYSST